MDRLGHALRFSARFVRQQEIDRYWLRQNNEIKDMLRARFYLVFIGRTKSGCMELCGCEWPVLRAHIEGQFRDGMTWQNYGKLWVVGLLPNTHARVRRCNCLACSWQRLAGLN